MRTTNVLGHELVGHGPLGVVVTNDWLCDTSTWDGAREYIDESRFTFAFVDLRGYGRSRDHTGAYTLPEAASDVMALADALGWARFSWIGHSMSSLIAADVAQHHPERIERVVLLNPPPPRGLGADEATLQASRSLALADDAGRIRSFEAMFGTRLSPSWARFKASRWRSSADPRAAASYVAMFARDGLPDPEAHIAAPVLAITGEDDSPWMRRDRVQRLWGPLCSQLLVHALADCGHYPMQEMPPRTVTLIERFLGARPATQDLPAHGAHYDVR